MHPAPSVIFFTVFSGLGFGLMAWLGFGYPTVIGWSAFWLFLIAFVFAGGGLIASTFHLGNRKNALKSFSQWRTSWLSREAWMAVGTMAVMGLFALFAVFFNSNLIYLGAIGAVMALITVYTTSMMYAQLKTVPRWNHWTTSALFLLLALGGGAILVASSMGTILFIGLAALTQLYVWDAGDKRFGKRGHTMETATGLGSIGKVRMYEPPHSGTNYLLSEMVYVIARKHAIKLRIIAFVLTYVAPMVLAMVSGPGFALYIVALIAHIIGILAQRWLFFAEAEHVVGLYYDKR
ncbi:MAG: dimethyl sulfoxide reductase anchor subunit [Marinosulfonomonas sp.]|nr:dimethyl sulfoxide reductase anchor subunit [Marinosulfonomonas sp.]